MNIDYIQNKVLKINYYTNLIQNKVFILKVKQRHHLKKKKLKELKRDLGEYSTIIPNNSNVEYLEVDPNPFILIDGQPYIIIIDEKPFPTLKAALENEIGGKKSSLIWEQSDL